MALVKVRNDADDGWIEVGGRLDITQSDTAPATTFPGMLWLDTDATGAGSARIQDADGDTSVDCEESGDEDIIRFDVAGSEAMNISADGEVTTPMQPAFFGASLVDAITDMADGVTNWLSFLEVYDISSDYSGYTFTCPVDGWYQVDVSVNFNDWDTAATYYRLNITTSNNSILTLFAGSLYADNEDYCELNSSICAYCDANDTITLWVRQDDAAAQTDVYNSANYTWASIRLSG